MTELRSAEEWANNLASDLRAYAAEKTAKLQREHDELLSAILSLPTPPKEMGDGPDERVGNVLTCLSRASAEIIELESEITALLVVARAADRVRKAVTCAERPEHEGLTGFIFDAVVERAVEMLCDAVKHPDVQVQLKRAPDAR